MCGIAGIVSKNIQKEKIESMLKDLSHRGPDNTSYKIYKYLAGGCGPLHLDKTSSLC